MAVRTTTGETSALCASVGSARASWYRQQRPARPRRQPVARAVSPRALGPRERQAVLDVRITARQAAPGTTIVTPDDPQHRVIPRPLVVEDRPIVNVTGWR
jgi:hypothetical protein